MAFHPFGIVRKYQKVLMALATVFCMGVFILQFGRGDLIESLLGRGGQNKGEKLITLYGKDVYSSNVTRDRQGRQLANQLVQAAVGSAGGDANKNVMAYNPDKPNADDDQLKQLRGALTSRSQFIYQLLQVRPNRQIQEFLGSIAGQVEHNVATLDALQISIGSSDQPDKAKAAEQTRMIKNLRLLFKLQYLLASGPGALYFGGGVKDEDILDFEVWKHQAEKLGVVLTKADARRLIAHEAGDRGLPADPGGSWASDPLIKAFLDDPHTQMTEYQLVTAVVDEFRVEIAQNLLAGRASGVPALGAPNLTTDSFARTISGRTSATTGPPSRSPSSPSPSRPSRIGCRARPIRMSWASCSINIARRSPTRTARRRASRSRGGFGSSTSPPERTRTTTRN